MLAPMAVLALGCLVLGLFPGLVLRGLQPVLASLPDIESRRVLASGTTVLTSGLLTPPGFGAFDHVVPAGVGIVMLSTLGLAAALVGRARVVARRAPTWGCGGELSARTEYTATAFSKPLMMVFRAVYRPTRQVDTLHEVSPYFPHEVRYRAEIEPTFERYIYAPVVRSVLRIASGMKVLQAGSLHAYLSYVLVLGVLLLIWLGGAQ
jgi:hydrogenase-4 component B